MRQPGLPVASGDRAIARMNQKGDEMMKKRTDERRKLKQLISQMDNAQFEWFISQMRLVLFEEDDEPVRLKDRPQTHT